MGFFLLLFFLAVNAAFVYAFFNGLWHWLTGTPFANGRHPPATAKSEFTTLITWAVAAAITYALVWLTPPAGSTSRSKRCVRRTGPRADLALAG